MNRTENINYKCSVLKMQVDLTSTYTNKPGGIEETLVGFNCKNACVECGVVTNNGLSKSYDWSNCPAKVLWNG
ncbi:MAG: hypothetical protein WCH01_11480 [Methylococcaceae bacterium]